MGFLSVKKGEDMALLALRLTLGEKPPLIAPPLTAAVAALATFPIVPAGPATVAYFEKKKKKKKTDAV